MSLTANPQQSREPINPTRPTKGDEVTIPEEMAIAGLAAQINLQPLFFAKEIGEMTEKLNGMKEENYKLREKLKAVRDDNAAMSQKIGTLEDKNRKQEETIRSLESSYEKLVKELENVKKAKDQLRIDLETKTVTFGTKNTILEENFEALTKDFKTVEDENKELKRILEEVTSSNSFLKETIETMGLENVKLKDDMASLKEQTEKIREKLDRKETRLALGQVAWLLEIEIWQHVLPDEKMGTTRILQTMERWLKRNASKKKGDANNKGEAAQKRWEELKAKLNWDEDDHKLAIKILKDLRVDDAHPKDVDLEVARKQLNEGDYVADAEKKSCEDIINMVVAMRKLKDSTE